MFVVNLSSLNPPVLSQMGYLIFCEKGLGFGLSFYPLLILPSTLMVYAHLKNKCYIITLINTLTSQKLLRVFKLMYILTRDTFTNVSLYGVGAFDRLSFAKERGPLLSTSRENSQINRHELFIALKIKVVVPLKSIFIHFAEKKYRSPSLTIKL